MIRIKLLTASNLEQEAKLHQPHPHPEPQVLCPMLPAPHLLPRARRRARRSELLCDCYDWFLSARYWFKYGWGGRRGINYGIVGRIRCFPDGGPCLFECARKERSVTRMMKLIA